ncbi:transposase [Streptomyces sp. NPDC002742]|uniref:transposase n=1 Tax=Streptomyces sp. NPDC002742 TaxID=3364663 RepID=UPI0036849A88
MVHVFPGPGAEEPSAGCPPDSYNAFFRRWRDHALVREFHDRLGATVREKLGRDAEPSAGVIDSQSVKADAVVGSDSRGFDGGKLVNGRKRHVVVDTLGLPLGVMVTAADTGDRAAAQVLLRQVADAHHRGRPPRIIQQPNPRQFCPWAARYVPFDRE